MQLRVWLQGLPRTSRSARRLGSLPNHLVYLPLTHRVNKTQTAKQPKCARSSCELRDGLGLVIDEHTLAFADFRGNKQYVSTGNLATDDRVALIFVDYPRQLRLKILGHVKIFEGDKVKEWLDQVCDPRYKAIIERVYVIQVEAFDWNCPQHIVPRFTLEEIREVLAPVEKHVGELEKENERLKNEVARLTTASR
jgi:predicted pyridoxine 5'-phosphate oxidase superfamily flavin-nucleotide-binding protein